jgi:large subunit ribosomal protein L35
MPKLKTKKTLAKRVKITKNGKILRGQVRTGHLKRKWSASKKSRKTNRETQNNTGHKRLFRRLLGKAGKAIK